MNKSVLNAATARWLGALGAKLKGRPAYEVAFVMPYA